METRQLGKSDLHLPVVTFGAWVTGGWQWGGSDDEQSIRAIQRGIDLGITAIDTAAIYGMGHSERVVAKAIAGRRDQVIVATKCGLRWDREEGEFAMDSYMPDGTPCNIYRNLRKDSIKYECEQSLKRLGIDTIDLYQCHWPDPTTPIEESMEALRDLQQEGKIRAIGVSNFEVEHLREAQKTVRLASNQPRYNYLERKIEQEVLPYCRENAIGILAYSPMLHGLLTGKVTMDRTFPESDFRSRASWFQPENRKKVLDMLEKIRPIAEGHGATLSQLAINWVISQPGITTALVGARDEQQVEENAKAASFRLSAEEEKQIRGLAEGLGSPE
ncbi:MAG: aldo/keto reductase [Candidatus Hydrogenedentota bacterium]